MKHSGELSTILNPGTGPEVKGGRRIFVNMPGCSLAWLTSEAWDAPRMVIDGSSWYWRFASLKERG